MTDLFGNIKQQVLTTLPHNPSDYAALERLHVSDLLPLYFNWRGRSVPSRPRTIHQSDALLTNPLASDPAYKPGLDRIIALIEAGQDLTPHLSGGINNPYQATGPARTSHLDLLLNDWGIHHLHLGTTMRNDGLVVRTRPLLFAIFRPEDAYLIDIARDHSQWTNEDIIRVIVREWPTAGLVQQVCGFDGLGAPLSAEQRKQLRDNHLMGSFEIDGAVYAPPRTLTTSGVAMEHTEAGDELLHRVIAFQKHNEASPDYIATVLTENGITPPPTTNLHFEFFEDGAYGIVERNSGVRFDLTR